MEKDTIENNYLGLLILNLYAKSKLLFRSSQNNGINAGKGARKLFNKVRSNPSREETNEIREKLHKKESVYNFFKGKRARRQFNKETKESAKEYW